MLHPDKLLNFPGATKTFQCVVDAFDRITKPELYLDAKIDNKNKAISRTNDGCYKTYIACPRCKVE